MKFGAYVLSTFNGFKFEPFGSREVWNLLAGNETKLDLNSALGLKAGHIIMRYQKISFSGKNIHAYSIYQGALEPNVGRTGTFMGLSLFFEEKIDAEAISIGQILIVILDGLSKYFIEKKRLVRPVDSNILEIFFNDDLYHDILKNIANKSERLLLISPKRLNYKNIFLYTEQELSISFDSICNSINVVDEFYLIGGSNKDYISIAKNMFSHVSEWPIPSGKTVAAQQNILFSKQPNINIRPQAWHLEGKYDQAEEAFSMRTKYYTNWIPHIKNASIILFSAFAVVFLLFQAHNKYCNVDPVENKQLSPVAVQGEINNTQIASKIEALILEIKKLNEENKKLNEKVDKMLTGGHNEHYDLVNNSIKIINSVISKIPTTPINNKIIEDLRKVISHLEKLRSE